jgi:hypothetical protein
MKLNIQKGFKSHFHLQNGLLWYKQNRLYVPKGRLRDVLLKECHDGPLAGHGGAKRTITFLKKSYYWPNLKDDVEEYVKTYLTCHSIRNKQDCYDHYRFLKGHGKVCPWILQGINLFSKIHIYSKMQKKKNCLPKNLYAFFISICKKIFKNSFI